VKPVKFEGRGAEKGKNLTSTKFIEMKLSQEVTKKK